jgi:hypothetical protein
MCAVFHIPVHKRNVLTPVRCVVQIKCGNCAVIISTTRHVGEGAELIQRLDDNPAFTGAVRTVLSPNEEEFGLATGVEWWSYVVEGAGRRRGNI